VSAAQRKRKGRVGRRAAAGGIDGPAGRLGQKEDEVSFHFSFFSFKTLFKFKTFQLKTFQNFSNFFTKFYKLFKPHTNNQKPCIAK
jgi:hypothetical protein